LKETTFLIQFFSVFEILRPLTFSLCSLACNLHGNLFNKFASVNLPPNS
jgi:hypothetical protein